MVTLTKFTVAAVCVLFLVVAVSIALQAYQRKSVEANSLAAQSAREANCRYYNPRKQKGIEARESELIKAVNSLPHGFSAAEARKAIPPSKVPQLVELLASDAVNPSLCIGVLAAVDEPQHAFDTTLDFIFTRGQFHDIEVGVDTMMGRACNVVLLGRFPPAIAGPFLTDLLSSHGAFDRLRDCKGLSQAPTDRLHSLQYRLEYNAALALAFLGDKASDDALTAFYDRLKRAQDTAETETLACTYAEVYGMRDMVRDLGREKVLELDVDAKRFLGELIPYMTKYQTPPTP